MGNLIFKIRDSHWTWITLLILYVIALTYHGVQWYKCDSKGGRYVKEIIGGYTCIEGK